MLGLWGERKMNFKKFLILWKLERRRRMLKIQSQWERGPVSSHILLRTQWDIPRTASSFYKWEKGDSEELSDLIKGDSQWVAGLDGTQISYNWARPLGCVSAYGEYFFVWSKALWHCYLPGHWQYEALHVLKSRGFGVRGLITQPGDTFLCFRVSRFHGQRFSLRPAFKPTTH